LIILPEQVFKNSTNVTSCGITLLLIEAIKVKFSLPTLSEHLDT